MVDYLYFEIPSFPQPHPEGSHFYYLIPEQRRSDSVDSEPEQNHCQETAGRMFNYYFSWEFRVHISAFNWNGWTSYSSQVVLGLGEAHRMIPISDNPHAQVERLCDLHGLKSFKNPILCLSCP